MKIEIEVDDELERTIVIRALKWHYDCCDPEAPNKSDREYHRLLRPALDRVLEAWMTPDEYAEWKDER